MTSLMKSLRNPIISFLLGKTNQFSTSSLAMKAMSCVRVPTVGELRKIKWYPYPIHDTRRCHFPRAKETKRIVVHGFDKKMSTESGRNTLMRRLLKGRHVLSH